MYKSLRNIIDHSFHRIAGHKGSKTQSHWDCGLSLRQITSFRETTSPRTVDLLSPEHSFSITPGMLSAAINIMLVAFHCSVDTPDLILKHLLDHASTLIIHDCVTSPAQPWRPGYDRAHALGNQFRSGTGHPTPLLRWCNSQLATLVDLTAAGQLSSWLMKVIVYWPYLSSISLHYPFI